MRVIRFPHGCRRSPECIPLDTPGLLGDIARQIHSPRVIEFLKAEWSPHWDYEFIAGKMPEDQREPYLARCSEWFSKYVSQKAPCGPREVVEESYDRGVVQAVYSKYMAKCIRPPLDELVDAYTRAGASASRIDKVQKFYKKWDEDREKYQSAIDKVFSKYPSALKPGKEIVKKKIIRAVKKKIPDNM